MISPVGRSLEIDFFRGVVLIVIALDHISNSLLSLVTLHTYAFCDSAEVFVFLGGYASAAAYASLASRRSTYAANRRFVRRALEIYRAYLFTAALMLLAGAALMMLRIDTPLLRETEWPQFLHRPDGVLFDIATLRLQPYLSAVLPMYSLFALSVPLSVPFAERAPVGALFASLAVWLCGSWLARGLPSAEMAGWSFNPFAWQLMFMLGVLCRLHPVSDVFQTSVTGRWLTVAAIAITLALAVVKLFIDTQAPPGYTKQNLESLRIVNFVSIAWLVAQAVRLRWVRALAERLPSVVNVGRHGLVCFVGGTLVSIAVDTVLRLANLGAHWPTRLAGDVAAVAALLLLAKAAREWKAGRLRTAAPHPVAVPVRVLRRDE